MAEIRLWNTRTRSKELLQPIDRTNVRMYVCGPTVYDRAHMGNARPVIVFDVLYRLLRHVYGPEHVTYVRNFTDVDDKINRRSQESGRPISEITEETIGWYHDDMGKLGVMVPNHEPRATQYIGEMIAMIEGLISDGFAYEAEGHVLFAVEKYAEYGALSGRSVDDMIAGARVEVAPYKRNPMDFVLWKPSTDDLPGWESPWGRGRPGWHIECSAMSLALLGESFDIHGGGNDLMFPHHENEIAQSKCAHPESDFARIWMHNEMLQVEGKKMSKSLGNFFTVHDVLEQGIPGDAIRFVYLSTHYRKPMDWTKKKRDEALSHLISYSLATENVDGSMVVPAVVAAIANDLDTPGALKALQDLYKSQKLAELRASSEFLGLLSDDFRRWVAQRMEFAEANKYFRELMQYRTRVRSEKNYAESDRIREELAKAGITIKDKPDGSYDQETDFPKLIDWAEKSGMQVPKSIVVQSGIPPKDDWQTLAINSLARNILGGENE